MPDALDGDYSRSRAVLMGTWSYRHLKPVDAAERSYHRMRDLLRGPVCGEWPEDRMTAVANPETVGELRRELVEAFLDVEDVALFYFVGHGLYDYRDRLHLTVQATEPRTPYRGATSLPFESVREAFHHSRARTKIAVLDCCFAGLAARAEGSLAIDMPLPQSGSYLMMSSSEYAKSWYELPDESAEPQTYFTKYFVDTAEAGIAGRPPGLTLDDLFATVARRLVRDGIPEPRSRTDDYAARFAFARNKAAENGPDALYEEAYRLEREGGAEHLPTMKALYRTAAEQGHGRAMCRLGLIEEGRTLAEMEGTPLGEVVDTDVFAAVRWYTRASEGGDEAAPLLLGRVYEEVFREPHEALRWYQLAVNRGNSAARERLNGLRYRLDHGLGPPSRDEDHETT
ncbi:caspase family protein [Glycomyces sp. A-F 0318]|uniref:caspase, EACC1-associated type n=1 Tax=Glycomyces amatae TaxID=2881355 RepID=UPI001E60EC28|nr:caspase family protein [Glycomyces amatae]MCD0444126.1 caspase family protein [Glycomyces amatae]